MSSVPQTTAASESRLHALRVSVFDNHDGALQVWRDAGVGKRALVHVDAHHDCWWVEKDADICIANFIAPAIRDGQIREYFWVLPDASWESRWSKAHVLIHLQKIAEKFPHRSRIETKSRSMEVELMGCHLQAVPLRYFRAPAAKVLLDIDTDFMLIDSVTYAGTDSYPRLPWCWPEELLSQLAAAGLQTDLATVAYSVTGGYTPLEWKWLGDEIALRLQGADEETLRPFRVLREGALSESNGQDAEAERLYREALALGANAAAARFRLSRVLRRAGRIEEARQRFREAVELDPSYATPYRSRGFFCQASRLYAAAQTEHLGALEFDEADPYPHLGLAQAFLTQKRYLDAESHLRRALELDPQMVDAHAELGEVLRHLGQYEEAVSACEKYLQLTLSGKRGMAMPISTSEPTTFHLDSRHFRIHARRADALYRMGHFDTAARGYQMSIAAGYDRARIRARLARCCLRLGRTSEAMGQALAFVPAYLREVTHGGRKFLSRLTMRTVAVLKVR